jgi:hypothetical protein
MSLRGAATNQSHGLPDGYGIAPSAFGIPATTSGAFFKKSPSVAGFPLRKWSVLIIRSGFERGRSILQIFFAKNGPVMLLKFHTQMGYPES